VAAAFARLLDGEITWQSQEGQEASITDDLPVNESVWLAHRIHLPG
jgi:hypothetical protein